MFSKHKLYVIRREDGSLYPSNYDNFSFMVYMTVDEAIHAIYTNKELATLDPIPECVELKENVINKHFDACYEDAINSIGGI